MRALQIQRRPAISVSGPWPDTMHPVLRRVYSSRGALAPAAIDHRLAALQAPQGLGGIKVACEILETALLKDLHIVVVGDFDADGATGTAVAVRGLRAFGVTRVTYRVPNRFVHGYGLSPELVTAILPQAPDLIITVDNGIASLAGVAEANSHGIQVIVTDHHLPGERLPAAAAIVNPNLPGDTFSSKALCGVGVVFYLLLALRAHLRETGWFSKRAIAPPDLSPLLDLVALGTVADLVPLDFNNRILVQAGLKRIRAGRACAGIAALIKASNRSCENVTAADLAFALAPRINAAGRLEDMSVGIECLLTDGISRAQELAEQLSVINATRRELQISMVEEGEAEVARLLAQGEQAFPFGVTLFDPRWHQGVVGLVASKLKEKLHRPVIACALAGEHSEEIKASARSVPGFHIRDALAEIDTRHPGLLLRYGGHAMAAGLSLRVNQFDAFSAAFEAIARERLTPSMLDAVLLTDGELEAADFNFDLAQQLRYAGPWGQEFPEPLFDNEFMVDSWRRIGESHLRMKLRLTPNAPGIDSMMFGGYSGEPPPERIRAGYQLDIDDWRGGSSIRLLVRHYQPA